MVVAIILEKTNAFLLFFCFLLAFGIVFWLRVALLNVLTLRLKHVAFLFVWRRRRAFQWKCSSNQRLSTEPRLKQSGRTPRPGLFENPSVLALRFGHGEPTVVQRIRNNGSAMRSSESRNAKQRKLAQCACALRILIIRAMRTLSEQRHRPWPNRMT